MADKIEIKHRYTGAVLYEYMSTGEQQASGIAMRVALEAAVRRGAYLSGADLRGADLSGADLSGAYLSGADLRGAYLRGADLSGAYLSGAYLSGAYLSGADLRGAYLRGVDLSGAYLSGAYLSGAYLSGAYLSGAYLSGAYLSGAYLSGAYLSGGLKLVGDRPILIIGPIGSRSDYLIAYTTNRGVYLSAGCFFGSAAKFSEKCAVEHKSNAHWWEYRAALALIDKHAELWAPASADQPGAVEP